MQESYPQPTEPDNLTFRHMTSDGQWNVYHHTDGTELHIPKSAGYDFIEEPDAQSTTSNVVEFQIYDDPSQVPPDNTQIFRW